MAPSPVLLGYFQKRRTLRPDWRSGVDVDESLSVSTCIADGPDGWDERWLHNDYGAFPSIALASDIVPDDERSEYRLVAWRMVPELWTDGETAPLVVDAEGVEPLPAGAARVGWDVVELTQPGGFSCSPLSCNRMCEEIPVNRYCLLDDLDTARDTARRFSVEKPEYELKARETITVPAGEFDTVVAEIKGFFGAHQTVWMIVDKPGLYAKVNVLANAGAEGDQTNLVYELAEVKVEE